MITKGSQKKTKQEKLVAEQIFSNKMYRLVGILVTSVSSECQNITLVKEDIHQRSVVCLIMAGLGCHCISHCFLLTEASKSEKLTCEVSGLAIKGRLTTCKSAMWTRDMDVKREHVKHIEGIKIHRKGTKLVIVLMEK